MAEQLSADVTGDEDLQKAMRGLSVAVSGSVREGLVDSARMIVRGAQERVPRRTGAARSSLQVESTPDGAQIVAGGSRAPYYGWLDFGGRVGRRGTTVRTFVRDGRYLYPAVNAHLDDIEAAAAQAVVNAGAKEGVTVTDG